MRGRVQELSRSGIAPVLIVALLLAHASIYPLGVQDDTFISLRYADNLVSGHGLVFNPGERVEGYTNFLWTLYLALGLWLGGSPLLVAAGGGVVSLCLLVGVAWRLSQEGSRDAGPLALVAPLLVAAIPCFVVEATQGLESALFSALVSWCCLEVLRAPFGASARVGLAGALLTLTRPEGIAVFLGVQGIAALHRRVTGQPVLPEGPARVRVLSVWAAVLGVLAAHVAFRLWYYGAPLPNTFYAKTGGGAVAWARGIHYLWTFARLHVVFCLLALLGAVALLRREPRALRSWLLLGLPVGCAVYVVLVGGDFKPTFRFVLPVLGPLALLAQEALVADVRVRGPARLVVPALGLLALVLADLRLSSTLMDREAGKRAAAMDDWIAVGRFLGDHAPPDTVLAMHSVGTVPYVSKLRTIDMWGLTNTHIARVEMEGMGSGTAGHEKFDYEWVFAQRPHVYLPEEDLLTAEPTRLVVPTDFPADFLSHYQGTSIRVGERWLNAFFRKEDPLVLR